MMMTLKEQINTQANTKDHQEMKKNKCFIQSLIIIHPLHLLKFQQIINNQLVLFQYLKKRIALNILMNKSYITALTVIANVFAPNALFMVNIKIMKLKQSKNLNQ
jgi:hypothetical protein